MPIFYALVARKNVVLAEFTGRTGNFPTVTRTLLAKIPEADGKQSYLYDTYTFHYIVERSVTYLCLTDEKNKRRLPFSFLDDIKAKFQAAYAHERIAVAIAFSMNAEFSRVMEDRLNYFNDNPNADAFGKVKGQLDEVKGVMVDNIEKVLARGEKIELLVDKTEALNQSAKKFQKSAKTLKNAMWWKNVKMWLMIIVLLALVGFVIAGFACGWGFGPGGKCGPKQ